MYFVIVEITQETQLVASATIGLPMINQEDRRRNNTLLVPPMYVYIHNKTLYNIYSIYTNYNTH